MNLTQSDIDTLSSNLQQWPALKLLLDALGTHPSFIFVDGSRKHTATTKAASAAYYRPSTGEYGIAPVTGPATSGRGEWLAVVGALTNLQLTPSSCIISDYKAVVSAFAHFAAGKPRSFFYSWQNADLILQAYDLWTNQQTPVLWVKAHLNIFGNEVADRLAKTGLLVTPHVLPTLVPNIPTCRGAPVSHSWLKWAVARTPAPPPPHPDIVVSLSYKSLPTSSSIAVESWKAGHINMAGFDFWGEWTKIKGCSKCGTSHPFTYQSSMLHCATLKPAVDFFLRQFHPEVRRWYHDPSTNEHDKRRLLLTLCPTKLMKHLRSKGLSKKTIEQQWVTLHRKWFTWYRQLRAVIAPLTPKPVTTALTKQWQGERRKRARDKQDRYRESILKYTKT
jgi:ribonuclease HI